MSPKRRQLALRATLTVCSKVALQSGPGNLTKSSALEFEKLTSVADDAGIRREVPHKMVGFFDSVVSSPFSLPFFAIVNRLSIISANTSSSSTVCRDFWHR